MMRLPSFLRRSSSSPAPLRVIAARPPATIPTGPGNGCCVYCLATPLVRVQSMTSWRADCCEDRQACNADMLRWLGRTTP